LLKEIARLWNELNVSEQSRHKTDDNLLIAHQKITDLEAMLSSDKSVSNGTQGQVQILTLQLEDAKVALQKQVDALTVSMEKTHELQRECDVLESQLHSNEEEIKRLLAQIAAVEKMRLETSQELLSSTEQAARLDVENATLRKDKMLSKGEVDKANMNAARAEDKVMELANLLKITEENSLAINAELSDQKHRNELQAKDVEQLQGKYDKGQEIIAGLENKVTNASAKITTLEAEVARLNVTIAKASDSSVACAVCSADLPSRYAMLSEDLMKSKDRLTSLTSDMAEIRAKNEGLKKDLSQSQIDLNRSETSRSALEVELGKSREKAANREAEIRSLRIELSNLKEEYAKLDKAHAASLSKNSASEQYSGELNRLRNELNDAKMTITVVKSDAKQALDKLSIAEDAKKSVEKRMHATEEKLSDAEKELRNALENLAKLQGELNAEIRRSKSLETELDDANNKLSTLNLSSVDRDEAIESLNNRLAKEKGESAAKIKELQKLLDEALSQHGNDVASFEIMQEDLADSRQKIEQLEGDLKAKNAALDAIRKTKDKEIADLMAQLNTLKKDSDSKEKSLIEANEYINRLLTECEALKADLKKSEQLRRSNDTDRSSNQSELIKMNDEIRSLKDELAKALKDLAVKNAEFKSLEGLQGRVSALEDLLKKSEDAYEGQRDALTAARHENEILNKDLAQSNMELDKLKKALQAGDSDASAVRKELAALEAQITELKAIITSQKEELVMPRVK
jgi:early endosome antigen 1